MLTEIVRFAVISYKFYQLFPSIPFFFYYSFRPSRRWKIPTDFQTWIAKIYGKLNAVSARNTFVKTSINYRKIRAYFLEFFSSYIKKKKEEKKRLERKLRKNPWHRTLWVTVQVLCKIERNGIENWYAKSNEWVHRIETRWSNFDSLKTRKYRSKRFMGNEDQLLEFERKRIF